MKVFDFDNTLYDGESAIDFVLYLIKGNKKILLWLPKIGIGLLKYKLCLVGKNAIEDQLNAFLKFVANDGRDLKTVVAEFWAKNEKNLKPDLLKLVSKEDAIITGSPSFLIEGIKDKLGTSKLDCSDFDMVNYHINFLNYGENKVKKYRELYGDKQIDVFYTDSYNDQPMMDISNEVYLVTKNKVEKIK